MTSIGNDTLQDRGTGMGSLGQLGGEEAHTVSRPSPLASDACIQALHDLNNAFSGVLMNAQVMDFKLPSYSRSKRYIHEIERSAQRGSALIKRLLAHLAAEYGGDSPIGDRADSDIPPVIEVTAVMANQGPPTCEEAEVYVSPSSVHAAPVFDADLAAHNRL